MCCGPTSLTVRRESSASALISIMHNTETAIRVDYLIGNHDGAFCTLREENSYEAQRISRLETAVVYVMQ